MLLEIGYLTDRGSIRTNNEDNLYVNGEIGLFIVADGAGGHNGGEIASKVAVERVSRYVAEHMSSTDDMLMLLDNAISDANGAIYGRSTEDLELAGMCTTIVVAVPKPGRLYIAHVGDSRAYALQESGLRLLTDDHTIASEWLSEDMSSDVGTHGSHTSHILTRALGAEHRVEVTVGVFPYDGETVLLCSDGLTDMVSDAEIEAVLRDTSEPQASCERLIELANQRGGRDNVTTVVFRRHVKG